MAAFAGTTLIWPGTTLDKLWCLNEPARLQLQPASTIVGPLFFLLTITLAIAALGWFKQRIWGWRLAVLIISTQVVGDFVNVFKGDFIRGCVGVLIAGCLLFYLVRSNIRTAFK
jgi:hypothetical protein